MGLPLSVKLRSETVCHHCNKSGSLAMFAAIAPGFTLRQQLCRRSPAGLFLEIDIGQRHAGAILHDEAGVRFLDGPRRREAAARNHPPARWVASCQIAKNIRRKRTASHPSRYATAAKIGTPKTNENACNSLRRDGRVVSCHPPAISSSSARANANAKSRLSQPASVGALHVPQDKEKLASPSNCKIPSGVQLPPAAALRRSHTRAEGHRHFRAIHALVGVRSTFAVRV